MKASPCCHEPIVKKKRFGGQVLLTYCGKCGRRIWGDKIVTRQHIYQNHAEIVKKLNNKYPLRQAKLLDEFTLLLVERYNEE